MSNELDKGKIIQFPQVPQRAPEPIRARTARIYAKPQDIPQIRTTVIAYMEADMPFDHIINAEREIGCEVETMEVDAPIPLTQQLSEIRDNPDGFVAWQNRGERIGASHQLSGEELILKGTELVTVSTEVIARVGMGGDQVKEYKVIEIIGVSEKKAEQLDGSLNNAQIGQPASSGKIVEFPGTRNTPSMDDDSAREAWARMIKTPDLKDKAA